MAFNTLWRIGSRRRRAGSALLLALLIAATCSADPPEGYPFVAFDEGIRLAREQDKPVFLYFGRFGCTFCDRTNKEAFSDPEVRERYTDHYVLVYVDTESGRRLLLPSGERITEAELGARLKVFVTPVFAFLEPNATPIARTAGVKSVQDLKDLDRFVAQGHYREQTLRDFLGDR